MKNPPERSKSNKNGKKDSNEAVFRLRRNEGQENAYACA
jgi:hypothetical protein